MGATRRVALMTLIAACGGGGAIDVAGPPRGATAAAPLPPGASTISVPITVPIAAIRAQVLQKIPRVLVDARDEQVHKGVLADVHVERSGEPVVAATDGELRVSLPVRAHVRARPAGPAPRGPRPPPSAEVDASLEITVRLHPELTDDWSLLPHAAVTHRWVSRPVLQLGPLRVDLGDRADGAVRPKLAEAAAQLDRDLARELDLSAPLGQAWSHLAGAHPLRPPDAPPDAPAAWLSLSPTALFASPIEVDSAGVRLTAGVAGVVEILTAEPPPAPAAPLPRRSAPPEQTGARVRTQLRLGWDALASAARTQLVGRPIALPGGGEAVVTAVRDVYPSGAAIAAGLDVTATTSGAETRATLWLAGTPTIEGDAVRVVDFRYAADSDRWIVDAANAALSERVCAAASERLVLPLADLRGAALGALNAPLASGPVRGAVTRVDLAGVGVTDEALVVQADVVGDLTVTLAR